MKNLITILAAFSAISTAQAANITTVKVADGKTAYCKTEKDLLRNRIGAYRLKGVNANIDGEKLNIKGDIKFLACQKNAEGKVSFVNVSPFHSFSYTVPVTRNTSTQIDVATERVLLRSYVDGMYNKVDTLLGRSSDSNIEISMDLEEVLTAEQMMALGNGQAVKASVDSFILKTIVITDENGKSMRDQRAFGSFRFFIEFTNDEGIYKARIIK